MFQPSVRLALVLSLALSYTGLIGSASAGDGHDPDTKRIDSLILKLGSGKFQERRGAQKELEAIGVPALEQLKRVPTTDLETSKRAAELIHKIEEKVLTDGLLAAKRVHLKIKDMPALDAVNELARIAGVSIHVVGDRTKVADKKITLDTGRVTFWEVCDRLCTQAGLVEIVSVPVPPTDTYGMPQGVQSPSVESGITLVAGTPRNQHVSYAGSVRARVYPLNEGKTKHYSLKVEASAEPRIQGFAVVGAPIITQAVDNHGQKLRLVPPPAEENANSAPIPQGRFGPRGGRRFYLTIPLATQRDLTLEFVPGAKPAKTLKELVGTFTTQMVAPPEDLGTLTNLLQAAGQSVQGKDGGTLKLNAIEKLANGDYQLGIALETPLDPRMFGGMLMRNGMVQIRQIQIQIGVSVSANLNSSGLPNVLDAKGNKLTAVKLLTQSANFSNGRNAQDMTIIFHRPAGVGEPNRLVYHGTRLVNVTVPFAFRDVPLE
jgi:hypothetical protein